VQRSGLRRLSADPPEGGWNDPWKLFQGISVLSHFNSQPDSPGLNHQALHHVEDKSPNSAARAQRSNSTLTPTSAYRAFEYEVLTSAELAQRLKVKESWVVDQSKRSRTSDPIPIFRLGKHRRFRWGSPELNAWLERRAGNTTQQQRKAGSSRNGGTIE
jgi:hypothetical protein